MAGQRVQALVPFATSRTGGFVAAVHWPEGEMPDLDTLQRSRRIALNGVELETRWRVGSAPYRRWDANGNVVGTSLRLTYADFVATVAPAGTTPTGPSGVYEVVAADNSAVLPPTFPAWARSTRVWLSYTDVNAVLGNTVVGPIDVAARARASIPGSSWVEEVSGGRLRIEFECYVGPGRHARGLRALNHNDSGDTSNPPNPPVWIDGLTHFKGTLTFHHGNAFGTLHAIVARDAPYPYPSAPPDGGVRDIWDAARPTFLNAGAPANPYMLASWQGVTPRPNREELERPRALTLSGFTITVDHASAGVHWRPWHVWNHTSGAGLCTTMPTSGNTTTVPQLTGIGDGQGFTFAGTISATSANHAAEVSADPYVYVATPTLAHLRNGAQRRTFTGGAADGQTAIIRGPWLPLQDIPQAKLSSWLLLRNTLNLQGRTFQNPWHSWAPREGYEGYPYETEPTGANQGGLHYVVGWNGYGEATLAGSGQHLYMHALCSWRWFSARGGLLHISAFDGIDYVSRTQGRVDYSACWEGTSRLKTSRVGFGRQQYGGGNIAPDPLWNGAADSGVNPDTRGRWEAAKKTHHTTPPLFWLAYLADCPMARYLLRIHAQMAACGFPSNGYPFDQNPRENTTRAEGRGADIGWHHYLFEMDPARRARSFNHWTSRQANYLEPGHGASWRQIGGANDTRDTDAAICGVGGNSNATNLVQNQYLFWQASQAAWSMVRWAFEAPPAQASRIMDAVFHIARASLDNAFVCDPALLSAAAERPQDSCFAARRAEIIANEGPNSAGVPVEGVLQGKSKRTTPTNAGTIPVTFDTAGIFRDLGRGNGGVNRQTIPILSLIDIFPALRNDAGAMERFALVRSAYRAIEPAYFDGDEYVSVQGFATDNLRDTGGPVIPPPVAQIDVAPTTGEVGAVVEISAARSTFGGPASGVSIKFFAHYDSANPGTATATRDWTEATSYRHTYTGTGTFFPAVVLSQADGRISVARSTTPVRIGVPGTTDPPRAAGTLTNPVGIAPHTPTLDVSASTFTGAAGSTILRFWAHYDPSAPAAPTVQFWTAGQTFSPTYTEAGTFSPAFEIQQPDGQTDFLLFADAVLVIEFPIAVAFTVSNRAGSAPFTPTLNAASSSYGGPASATLLRWWKDYNPTAPGNPQLEQYASAGTTYAPTYSSAGIYFPALEIVQQDGRRAFLRDSQGIRVDTVAPSDSPVLEVSIEPRAGTVGMTALIDADGSTWFGADDATTFFFWRHFDPSSPGTPDLEITADRGTSYAATYDAAGTFYPAVMLVQQDGQRAFYRDRVGVEVGRPQTDPPRPAITISESDRTGSAPHTPLLNAGDSAFSGPSGAVTLEWWKNYVVASPGTPDLTEQWSSTTAYRPTYSSPGTYFPALRLTDSEGRAVLVRDTVGIHVEVVPVADPPAADFEALDDRTGIRGGDSVRLRYTGGGVPATSWEWYWEGAAGVATLFSTERDPVLETPEGEDSIDVWVVASNAFDTDTETKAAFVTFSNDEAPTAGFELVTYAYRVSSSDWPAPYLVVAANWSTPDAQHVWTVEPGGTYEGERPLDMLLAGPGDFVVSLTVRNTVGSASARRRVTVLSGEELEASFDPRGTLLEASFDPHAEGLRGTFNPSADPLP